MLRYDYDRAAIDRLGADQQKLAGAGRPESPRVRAHGYKPENWGKKHDARQGMGEKKPTPIKLELHAASNGKNKRLGGSQFDDWNNRLSDLIASALPIDKAHFLEGATAAAYGMIEINPADPIEAMIAGQATHSETMSSHPCRIIVSQRGALNHRRC